MPQEDIHPFTNIKHQEIGSEEIIQQLNNLYIALIANCLRIWDHQNSFAIYV